MSVTITAAEFQDYFDRGQFSYGSSLPYIREKDINSAIAEAEAVFNHDLYPTDDTEKQALYYLTAHFLTLDTEAAQSGGQARGLQNSRSADGLSEGITIPDWMTQGEYALYSTTYYGQKWIMLSKPYMGGSVIAVQGATTP